MKRMTEVSRAVALAVTVAVLLSACYQFNYELYISNTSDRTWLIRVNPRFRPVSSLDISDPVLYVRVIQPGADGAAVSWFGERENQVELLDPACHVVGVFESQDGVNYTVPGVDGITATIEKANNDPRETTPPLIDWTSSCGGEGPWM